MSGYRPDADAGGGEPAASTPRLLGPAEIRDLAELLGVTPTKKLGQNFVHDANTVRRIVQAAGVEPGETVLEIGPGLGSLTLGLLETGARVIAVEIDRRLAEQLPRTVELMQPGASLTVVAEDALKVRELPGEPVRLVANLPYNVSVPVLLHLLEHVPSLASGIVMVQAEVGHRLAAAPGSKVYGAPSVKAAWYADWRTAGQVSRQVFWPVPNVDSVLVAFERHDPPGTETERAATFALVDAAFQQRRKMLRQSLSGRLGGTTASAAAVLESAGIDPAARGEQLTVADFLAIARAHLGSGPAGVQLPPPAASS
ncbi:16S rRNA (adenine(1518)-N(6)/adenine(1519)-N(6))-dimethyltransferase RsmA [Agromyces archimandritae]|uniref:Ribosomal RNA small subunit methyltransferase A n=1 Tax=Agromyces archimandritae TaxID=2781962 RepID=A0A975INC2_9MICO|nr:16S rRNA (adenine(1518)-N(6)/adenine(1519)-N(6))-dimethyltransferase RsmA [Agromyces archimandritae]QTX04099.1 16S rRNA (adenine(1518)-N(6)/adenine(1519)-N(6))-dimethyltransferase RsmA [Agromyces archimandritae]